MGSAGWEGHQLTTTDVRPCRWAMFQRARAHDVLVEQSSEVGVLHQGAPVTGLGPVEGRVGPGGGRGATGPQERGGGGGEQGGWGLGQNGQGGLLGVGGDRPLLLEAGVAGEGDEVLVVALAGGHRDGLGDGDLRLGGALLALGDDGIPEQAATSARANSRASPVCRACSSARAASAARGA